MNMYNLKPNQYRCSMCQSVFDKAWSDEEAAAEAAITHGVPIDECDIVCDDCYKQLDVPQIEGRRGAIAAKNEAGVWVVAVPGDLLYSTVSMFATHCFIEPGGWQPITVEF